MTIRHIVTWKLASSDGNERAQQAAEVKAKLESLVGVVPEIERLEVGINVLEGNFDLALIADFADLDAVARYQVHPAHEEVAAYIRSVVGGRSAVDFEV